MTRRRKEFGQAAGSTLGQYSCVGHVGSSVGRLGHAPTRIPTPPTQKNHAVEGSARALRYSNFLF